MAVRSPSLHPLLTIHGAGSQQTESATSVSSTQMAPQWISYSLGKRGDAHDSLQGRLAATDGPRASWGNHCGACCDFGLATGLGQKPSGRNDAGPFHNGMELVDGKIRKCVSVFRR